MPKLTKEIADFMAAYGVMADEIWEVRTGGAMAIKHKALERIAAEKNITFDPPDIIEAKSADKIAAMCVTGRLGERSEWSIGEATPANNKNSYCYAMAEKRAKDRVILKLLNTHGVLYSEAEADEFAETPKRQNPHVTVPADIMDPLEYDIHGNPVDNIPLGDPSIETLSKANARKDWSKAQSEIQSLTTVRAMENWGATNANRIASYPSDWQEILRGVYRDHLTEIRSKKQEAA